MPEVAGPSLLGPVVVVAPLAVLCNGPSRVFEGVETAATLGEPGQRDCMVAEVL